MRLKITFTLFLSFVAGFVSAQGTVMVMDIRSEIDPRMNRYVELAINHSKEIEADVVLIDMDTYGGVLTDAKEIVDQLMEIDVPIWVFINTDAASAGALISIACDSIYMAPGASIGAATVVDASGEKAPDKYQSYMRSIMRSTAEENGRDPHIAEGMVDESIVIEGIKKEGEVLTFSTSEAIQYGFCEARVNSIEEILERNGMSDYKVVHFELSGTDKVIAFFLNPVISGVLILIILGGIWYEMQTPGVGFPIIAAGTALILYLVPYYLNGLAENWEIIALFAGIILIGLEIFVLPGFGIAGVSGIVLLVGSLILVMINNDFFDFNFVPPDSFVYAVTATLGGLLGGAIFIMAGSSRIVNMRFFKRIALTESQDREKGYTARFHKETLIGKRGTAYTVLRPSGKVVIDGILYDAFTRGEYIDKGQLVEVVSEDTSSIQVRLVQE